MGSTTPVLGRPRTSGGGIQSGSSGRAAWTRRPVRSISFRIESGAGHDVSPQPLCTRIEPAVSSMRQSRRSRSHEARAERLALEKHRAIYRNLRRLVSGTTITRSRHHPPSKSRGHVIQHWLRIQGVKLPWPFQRRANPSVPKSSSAPSPSRSPKPITQTPRSRRGSKVPSPCPRANIVA